MHFSSWTLAITAFSTFTFAADDNNDNTSFKNKIIFSNPFINRDSSFAEDTTDLRMKATRSKARRAKPKPFELRILPLGASITWGAQSSDGNGYRKDLRDQLRFEGWEVDMVGSVTHGTMADNDCEGHPGAKTYEMSGFAKNSIPYKPNLILINAGTNDAGLPANEFSINKIDKTVNGLLDELYKALPDVTIVLSTLLTTDNKTRNDRVHNIINPKYRDIVKARRAKKQRIVLADMYEKDKPWISLSELKDGIHPGDAGYKKMASIWWSAIQKAEKDGLLKAPSKTSVDEAFGNASKCKNGNGKSPGTRIELQSGGTGYDDGDFVPSSTDKGSLFSLIHSHDKGESHQFARLVNRPNSDEKLDDFLWSTDAGSWIFTNQGNGKFKDGQKLDVKNACSSREGVRWGDVNGDGLDDFLCVAGKGDVYASINRGGDPPKFEDVGQIMSAPDQKLSQDNVRLGDIDGDGRIDYCVIRDSGLECWRNGGQKDAPLEKYGGYWENMTSVFSAQDMGDIAGVNLVDINGDGRADVVSVNDHGEVKAWINKRGAEKEAIDPEWDAVGVVFKGAQQTGLRDLVRFGRVFNGEKSDYIRFESEKNSDNTFNRKAHVWSNQGKGGTIVKGDGSFFCDMRGTGTDDYVWIDANGKGLLNGKTEIFNINKPRKSIRLADFDGDGKCDVLAVRESDGAAELWHNRYDKDSKKFEFKSLGFVTNGAKCTQGSGPGMHDLSVQFADLDGDKKADYLCIEKDGRITGALNKGVNKFESVKQIKASEHRDRADIRLGDVNGDGRADILYVDKFSGEAYVWLNGGKTAKGGSDFNWKGLGRQFAGQLRGGTVAFANALGKEGGGKAQLIEVEPKKNQIYAWVSNCTGEPIGNDDGEIRNPKLPTRP